MAVSVKSNQIQAMFSALGDSTRYKIVQLLKNKPELCVSEVADNIGISTAGISQHMKVLEQAGLVLPQRMGQKTCYQLQSDSPGHKSILKLIK